MPDSRQPLAELPSAQNARLRPRPVPREVSHQDGAGHSAKSPSRVARPNVSYSNGQRGYGTSADSRNNDSDLYKQLPSTKTLIQPSEYAHNQDITPPVFNRTPPAAIEPQPPTSSPAPPQTPLSSPPSASLPQTPLSLPLSASPPQTPWSPPASVPDVTTPTLANLWSEIMAGNKQPQSVLGSLKRQMHISTQSMADTEMFDWSDEGFKWSNSGETATQQNYQLPGIQRGYQLHWLYHLKPSSSADQARIRKLALEDLTHQLVPSLGPGFQIESEKFHEICMGRWHTFLRQRIFRAVFPSSTGEESLLAQLGEYDLDWLPGKNPPCRGPDITYTLTAEMMTPLLSRAAFTHLYLKNQKYTAPHLSVFLPGPNDKEESEQRANFWGAHMLHARVAEWCRAFKLKVNELPSIRLNSNTVWDPQSNVISQCESKPPSSAVDGLTRANSRTIEQRKSADRQRPIPPSTTATFTNIDLPEGVLEEMPSHYCILINHREFSIWKFKAVLGTKFDSVIWQDIKCQKFKNEHPLFEAKHWDILAHDLLGIHLASAIHGGRLIKKATAWMHSPTPTTNDLVDEREDEAQSFSDTSSALWTPDSWKSALSEEG